MRFTVNKSVSAEQSSVDHRCNVVQKTSRTYCLLHRKLYAKPKTLCLLINNSLLLPPQPLAATIPLCVYELDYCRCLI